MNHLIETVRDLDQQGIEFRYFPNALTRPQVAARIKVGKTTLYKAIKSETSESILLRTGDRHRRVLHFSTFDKDGFHGSRTSEPSWHNYTRKLNELEDQETYQILWNPATFFRWTPNRPNALLRIRLSS